MQKYIMNFPSVTFAMKSEKLLNTNGINCSIIRTPPKLSSCGCGYSILINLNDLNDAKAILNRNKIIINSIYAYQE